MKLKHLLLPFTALISTAFIVQTPTTSFYNLKAKTIEGKDFDFSSLKGKKVLIVNTASECGYTPQYADLEKLYKTYKDKSFVILGFPSNDFGEQEPGSNKDIQEFCKKNYGVTFQMMEKGTVKGKEIQPVYQWLTQKAQNGKMDSGVRWNFQKYLIDENGTLVEMVDYKENPMSDKIVNWINHH